MGGGTTRGGGQKKWDGGDKDDDGGNSGDFLTDGNGIKMEWKLRSRMLTSPWIPLRKTGQTILIHKCPGHFIEFSEECVFPMTASLIRLQ